MKKFEYMRGDNPEAREAAEIVNLIIQVINTSGNKKPNATLYLGRAQKWALHRIEAGDPQSMRGDTFAGWPIVWVENDSYARLAV